MAEVITVVEDRKVMTEEIKHESMIFGDCTECGEPYYLLKNRHNGDETLICSNEIICGEKIDLKVFRFYE